MKSFHHNPRKKKDCNRHSCETPVSLSNVGDALPSLHSSPQGPVSFPQEERELTAFLQSNFFVSQLCDSSPLEVSTASCIRYTLSPQHRVTVKRKPGKLIVFSHIQSKNTGKFESRRKKRGGSKSGVRGDRLEFSELNSEIEKKIQQIMEESYPSGSRTLSEIFSILHHYYLRESRLSPFGSNNNESGSRRYRSRGATALLAAKRSKMFRMSQRALENECGLPLELLVLTGRAPLHPSITPSRRRLRVRPRSGTKDPQCALNLMLADYRTNALIAEQQTRLYANSVKRFEALTPLERQVILDYFSASSKENEGALSASLTPSMDVIQKFLCTLIADAKLSFQKGRVREIVRERIAGESLRDLGHKHGVSGEKVRQELKKHLYDPFPMLHFFKTDVRKISAIQAGPRALSAKAILEKKKAKAKFGRLIVRLIGEGFGDSFRGKEGTTANCLWNSPQSRENPKRALARLDKLVKDLNEKKISSSVIRSILCNNSYRLLSELCDDSAKFDRFVKNLQICECGINELTFPQKVRILANELSWMVSNSELDKANDDVGSSWIGQGAQINQMIKDCPVLFSKDFKGRKVSYSLYSARNRIFSRVIKEADSPDSLISTAQSVLDVEMSRAKNALKALSTRKIPSKYYNVILYSRSHSSEKNLEKSLEEIERFIFDAREYLRDTHCRDVGIAHLISKALRGKSTFSLSYLKEKAEKYYQRFDKLYELGYTRRMAGFLARLRVGNSQARVESHLNAQLNFLARSNPDDPLFPFMKDFESIFHESVRDEILTCRRDPNQLAELVARVPRNLLRSLNYRPEVLEAARLDSLIDELVKEVFLRSPEWLIRSKLLAPYIWLELHRRILYAVKSCYLNSGV